MGPALGPNALKSCPRTPTLMGPTSRSNSLGSRVGPKGNGSCVRTKFSWIQRQNPIVFDPASGLNCLRSGIKTQFYWVFLQDPRFLGLSFLNIIICILNIIIFIIIKSINMKNSIICLINIIILL
jgi:hypothetical protein